MNLTKMKAKNEEKNLLLRESMRKIQEQTFYKGKETDQYLDQSGKKGEKHFLPWQKDYERNILEMVPQNTLNERKKD